MNCPNCGTSLPDSAHFCPNCGTRLEAIPQTPYIPGRSDGYDADAFPGETTDFDDPASQQADLTPEQKKNTSVGVIVVVALAVLLVIGGIVGIVMYATAPRQQNASQATGMSAPSGMHGVTFMVGIDGYGEGSSRIPVRITGTTQDGTPVDQVAYLAYSGVDVQLPKGGYHAEAVGSPIATDGTIYEIPTLTIDFTLGDDLADGDTYTMPQDLALQYVPIEAASMTDQQIADAVRWAREDSESTADVDALEAAARKRRDDAVGSQQPNPQDEEEPQEEEPANDGQDDLDKAIADAKAEGKQVFTGTVHVMTGYEIGDEYGFDAEGAVGPDAAKDWVLLVFDEDTDVLGKNGDGMGSRTEKLDRIILPDSMASHDGEHVTVAVEELWFASDTVGFIAEASASDAAAL